MLSLAVALVALALPWLPWAQALDFVALPLGLIGTLAGLLLAYFALTELAKRLH